MTITYNNNFYEQVFVDKTKFHSPIEMVLYTCGKHCEISPLYTGQNICRSICEACDIPLCSESWGENPWYWKQITIPWKKLSIF